jgi:hypothetical protein
MPEASSERNVKDAVMDKQQQVKKLVIAIHGIGNQRRGETVRSVAHWFGKQTKNNLPLVPLGFFSMEGEQVRISRLESPGDGLDDVGFAEIYWADIPRKVVEAGDTLEETKAWGRSVAGRAEATYQRMLDDQEQRRATGQRIEPDTELRKIDFHRSAVVIEEIVESIAVLENLSLVLDKMGVFHFEVGPVLRDYLDDVQTVTEFKALRDAIVARFDGALTKLFETYQDNAQAPELYIVAHSEGSVVAFLALLGALSRLNGAPREAAAGRTKGSWIEHVRGFMTIGSPIDKHLILWPHLFDGLELACGVADDGAVIGEGALTLPRPIAWQNYFDHGDPIGFELDTAIEFLRETRCEAFAFTEDDNHGFSRYWLPGKAHNDYWNDAQVFGHFISHVVKPTEPPVKVPQGNAFRGFVSTSIPYLISLVLHVLAVFALYKGVTAFVTPADQVRAAMKGTAREIWLFGILLLATTIAARVPRLIKRGDWKWPAIAWGPFLAASALCLFLPKEMPREIGLSLLGDSLDMLASQLADDLRGYAGIAALVLVAAVVAVSGWLISSKERWGRRVLLLSGGAIVAAMVAFRICSAEESVDEPIWPLLLSGAAFLYLWWLGMMLFDLAFVWHRYIRGSVALNAFRPYRRKGARKGSLPPTSMRVRGRVEDSVAGTV